jgi:hypothetical protein
MNMPTEQQLVILARWSGRILSVLLIGLMVVLFVGHINSGGTCRPQGDHIAREVEPQHLRETALGVTLFTILAGLAIGWKWEGLGSVLILGGFVVFAIVNGDTRSLEPYPLHNPFFGFLITGLLFLFCWWRTHRKIR